MLIVSRWADNFQIYIAYPVCKPVCNRLIYFGPCRFQNVHLVSVKFCRLNPLGTGKGLRHLYVVEILRSAPCARSGRKNLEVKVLIEFFSLVRCQAFHVSFEPSNPVSTLSLSFFIFLRFIYPCFVFVV